MMNTQSKKEKMAAKILFWSLVVPITFTVFLRLFFVFFNFVYGTLIVKIIGQDYAGIVSGIAAITAIGFSIGVLIWIYKQFKKHILSTL